MNIESNHPLVGTWITENEDSDVEIKVDVSEGYFKISAICISDGEKFEVYDINWHENTLTFLTVMPSTKTKSTCTLSIRENGNADFSLTTYEVWKKKNL